MKFEQRISNPWSKCTDTRSMGIEKDNNNIEVKKVLQIEQYCHGDTETVAQKSFRLNLRKKYEANILFINYVMFHTSMYDFGWGSVLGSAVAGADKGLTINRLKSGKLT